jgi:hypothetical protein
VSKSENDRGGLAAAAMVAPMNLGASGGGSGKRDGSVAPMPMPAPGVFDASALMLSQH